MIFTISVGNPFDGIELQGLFDTREDATEAAEREFKNDQWSVVEINPLGRVS